MENSIKEAVDESRIHHQLSPMEISYEYGVTEVNYIEVIFDFCHLCYFEAVFNTCPHCQVFNKVC